MKYKNYLLHNTVLLNETISSLNLKKNGIYIDATFGHGGHSKLLLSKLGPLGKLYAIDKDPIAIKIAKKIKDKRFKIIHNSFSQTIQYFSKNNLIGKINGILLDLGISSLQINNPERGFSFMKDGPLDMRMNPKIGIPASAWLLKSNFNEIKFILKNFGEEKFYKNIAYAIIKQNKKKPIQRTKELVDLINKVIPKKNFLKNPATRTFQAIRIFINNELEEIKLFLQDTLKLLTKKGRLSVISFHSLEDRIVKNFIKHYSSFPYSLKDIPFNTLEIKKYNNLYLKKIKKIFPNKKEIYRNPSSRSAILRIAEKII